MTSGDFVVFTRLVRTRSLAALLALTLLVSPELAAQAQVGAVDVQLSGSLAPSGSVAHSAAPPALVAELQASSPSVLAQFGTDVALTDDTLFVGAPLDDTAGENAGAVYRFVRQGGAWIAAGLLLPADADPGQQFGKSLAVEIDGNDTLVVGSPGDSDVSPQRGSAYVFTRDNGGVWSQAAKLTSPDVPLDNAWFGLAVAVHAGTVVVGAPLETNDVASVAGSVYVFEQGAGGAWTQVAHLFPQPLITPNGAIFGSAVGVDGDRIVVGAPYLGFEFIEGRAYVFARGGHGWSQQQTFLAPVSLPRDRFGGSVAVRGGTLIVGSPRDAPPLLGTVATYAGGPPWSFVESGVTAPDGTPLDHFGTRLAVDASGERLLVGASAQDGMGAAYLFALDGQDLKQPSKLSAPDLAGVDGFGSSLALRGNWIAVGAPFHDAGQQDAGAVYMYRLQPLLAPFPVRWR